MFTQYTVKGKEREERLGHWKEDWGGGKAAQAHQSSRAFAGVLSKVTGGMWVVQGWDDVRASEQVGEGKARAWGVGEEAGKEGALASHLAWSHPSEGVPFLPFFPTLLFKIHGSMFSFYYFHGIWVMTELEETEVFTTTRKIWREGD